MHRAVTVMRRDGAAGQMHGLERAAAQKQEQHAASADVIGAQPLIAVDAVEAEHLLVERTGALEFIDIERSFQNAEQVGHGSTYSVIPGRASARSPESITTIREYGYRTCRCAAIRQ